MGCAESCALRSVQTPATNTAPTPGEWEFGSGEDEMTGKEELEKKCPIARHLSKYPRFDDTLRRILGDRALSCADRLTGSANIKTFNVLLLGTGDSGKSSKSS